VDANDQRDGRQLRECSLASRNSPRSADLAVLDRTPSVSSQCVDMTLIIPITHLHVQTNSINPE
jgi:hypothetical protein